MKKVQAYIAVRGSLNANENADVPAEQMALYSRINRPVLNQRVEQNALVCLALAFPQHGPGCGMSTESISNACYFDVCTMDYRKWPAPWLRSSNE
jgi:aminopeptidase